MKGNQAFLAIFCILYAHLSSVQSLSCKVGFGISEPGSHELKTYFSNTVTANNCGNSGASNPALEPIGCMKNVFKLSGGNLYVQYGCFDGSAANNRANDIQYGRHIYQYVCTTDNCNSSHNLKFNLVAISVFLFLSFAKYF